MVADTPKFTNIKEDFDYHPDGYLIRKTGHKKGIAGTPQNRGYILVGYEKKTYLLHKLIYYYHHGVYPQVIDHIDRDKSNNRIENLRIATKSLNEANTGLRINNSSGYKGVSFHKAGKKWRVYLQEIHYGFFDTAEEAAREYNKQATRVYGEYAYLNKVD